VTAALTADAVRALAPDASALKAGQGLANPRHWVVLGRSEAALWGRCQGSGKEPYQVVVDLAGPAAKCTCPSRKFPCKHGLGLMFIAVNGAIGKPQPEPPEVAQWLADREKRSAASAKRETEAVDDPKVAAARARDRDRRAAQREDRVAAGMAEFRRWLEEHHTCESRLSELAAKPQVTVEEEVEEKTLKKRKLLLKDQMAARIRTYETSNVA